MIFFSCTLPLFQRTGTRIIRDSLKFMTRVFFTGIINSFVHIIMYTYYLLAALLPHHQHKRYLWWKKYITTLQMVRSK